MCVWFTLCYRNNLECEKKKFAQEAHTCEVCFDGKTGTEFVKLERCGHYFCKECILQHCKLHTKEGSVQSLL